MSTATLNQSVGALRQHIEQLEAELSAALAFEADAMAFRRMQRHQRDLAEWLVDEATNSYGTITKPVVDAALGGEDFVPCTMTRIVNGQKYQMKLVSTEYEIVEA